MKEKDDEHNDDSIKKEDDEQIFCRKAAFETDLSFQFSFFVFASSS